MRHVAVLLLGLWSLAALAQQPRTSRCWTACERNVTDPRLRATACTACLTHPEDSAAWLSRAPAPLAQLLQDTDWQVRWAGLEDTATRTKADAAKSLAEWIVRAKDEELERACLTAIHVAGKRKVSLDTLVDKKAREKCRGRDAQLKTAIGVELYDERLPVRREALVHAASAFSVSQGRVVLDAVPSHPASFDALVLETLSDVATFDDRTAAAQLLAAAGPGDVAVMNRLLAEYGAQRDSARAQLDTVKDTTARKEAIATLARLAPLSEPELLAALEDADPAIRRVAARGLGRGLGGTIATAVEHYALGEGKASLTQQASLLKFMGDANDAACARVGLAMWERQTLDASLRRRALPTAASCSWSAAREVVEQILRTEATGLQLAAAVAALASAPKTEQLLERLEQALGNADASVRAAGCEAIAGHRWRGGINKVLPLLKDVDATVRTSAVDTLLVLEAPSVDTPFAHLLTDDPSPEVRVAAARALGVLGGPRALATLTTASRNDTNPNVKLVAAESLRKLGSGSPAPP